MNSFTKKKVVIIEDDEVMRNIISHKLEIGGFEVKTANEGNSGYLLIEQEKPDIVILDIMMPGMDGIQLLERLRSHRDQQIAETSVIILSNVWDKEQIFKANKFNVVAYMIKAYFTPDDILAKIEQVLKKSDKG